MNSYKNPPSQVSGMVSDYGDSVSIISPRTATNIVKNPSFVNGIDTYSATGAGTLVPYTGDCYKGGHCAKRVVAGANSQGGTYTTVNLISGQMYTFSCYVKARGGATVTLSFENNSGSIQSPLHEFPATGSWKRYSISWISNSSAVMRVVVNQYMVNVTGADYYTDCWQVEFGGVPTTYIDGDQYGCRWDGRAHASSSVRSVYSRRGGTVVPLGRYNVQVTNVFGVGMQTTPLGASYGLIPGGYFERSINQGFREFQIAGTISAQTARELRNLRDGLVNLLSPSNLGGIQQQHTILFDPSAFDGLISRFVEPVEIQAVYTGGLEDTFVGPGTQDIVLSFRAYDPVEFSTLKEDCVELSLGNSPDASEMNLLAMQLGDGTWEFFGGGVDASLYIAKRGDDGYIYAGGSHPTNGRKGVMRWDGSQWNILGTAGFNGLVYDMVWDASGNLYAVGAFTGNTNGTEFYSRIAKWDGSSWSALGSGLNGIARTVIVGTDGNIYVGGDFTTAGGSSANRVAYWDGSVWSTLGTGFDGSVYTIVEKSNNIYVGGGFTTAGGISADNIAKWDGSSWSTVGAGETYDGTDGAVRAIVVGQDGIIYLGGDFTNCGDVPANYIASWNGGQYSEVGSGVNNSVRGIALGSSGDLYICGDFTLVNGLPYSYAAHWTGTVWLPIEIFAGSTSTGGGESISYTGGNELLVTVNGRFEHTSDVTVANVRGSASTYPTIRMAGPGVIHNITNWQTRTSIFFDYTLQSGEVAVLRLEPSRLTFTSNLRGNVIGTIRPGSHIGQLSLVPGENSLSCLMYDTDSNSEVSVYWSTRLLSTDGAD